MPSSVAIMVVLIVMIVTIGKSVRARNHGMGGHHDAARIAEATRMHDEVRQLKERIAVLERVVTDNHGSIGLDREIERLRDR